MWGILDEKPSFLPSFHWAIDEWMRFHMPICGMSKGQNIKFPPPQKKNERYIIIHLGEILNESWMNPSLLACF